jgi:hypothetical protein
MKAIFGTNSFHLQGLQGYSSLEMTKFYIPLMYRELSEYTKPFGPADTLV